MRVEITCSDPAVAFAGEWPRAEGVAQILARYRELAQGLGVPLQIAIEREGIWSIAPNGKVIRGSLFDLAKLAEKEKRSGVRRVGRSAVRRRPAKSNG